MNPQENSRSTSVGRVIGRNSPLVGGARKSQSLDSVLSCHLLPKQTCIKHEVFNMSEANGVFPKVLRLCNTRGTLG